MWGVNSEQLKANRVQEKTVQFDEDIILPTLCNNQMIFIKSEVMLGEWIICIAKMRTKTSDILDIDRSGERRMRFGAETKGLRAVWTPAKK